MELKRLLVKRTIPDGEGGTLELQMIALPAPDEDITGCFLMMETMIEDAKTKMEFSVLVDGESEEITEDEETEHKEITKENDNGNEGTEPTNRLTLAPV